MADLSESCTSGTSFSYATFFFSLVFQFLIASIISSGMNSMAIYNPIASYSAVSNCSSLSNFLLAIPSKILVAKAFKSVGFGFAFASVSLRKHARMASHIVAYAKLS